MDKERDDHKQDNKPRRNIMSVQSVKMMEDIEDKARKECFDLIRCILNTKPQWDSYVENNWMDFVEDKHKYLFED